MMRAKRVGKEAVDEYLSSRGWQQDTWGHWHRPVPPGGSDYRIKQQKNTIRYEVSSTSGWVRLDAQLYSTISFSSKGMKIGRYYV